ncbi:alpha/beta hydrolase [Sneathiella glossodoripedis]|uniref:alpha/beta hydrolase n=1 Tax=Sneathiella glossodoripedis TaxID=418853 RepID=UPI0004714B1D|nr:alpha/beta fold hydrolase [Sneathiella glossodoripedis]
MTKIMPGAEPFRFEGKDCNILVIHGFTGSTQSMRYLGEELNNQFGFGTLGPCLAGHGTSPDDMETTGYLDWLSSAETALQELASLGKPVFVTGLSMGGMLTLHLAQKYPDIISGIAPINAVAGEHDGSLAELIVDVDAPSRIPGIGSDIKAPDVTELAYPEVPVKCLRDVYLAQAAIGDLLHKITCPVLVIQSRDDHVVHPTNAQRIVRKVSSSDVRLLWLDNSYHVATLDNDKDLIVESIGKFFSEQLAT